MTPRHLIAGLIAALFVAFCIAMAHAMERYDASRYGDLDE